MALAPEHAVIGIRRMFTTEGVHPYDLVEWERRDARMLDWRTGAPTFEQLGVEVPASWSVNATNILAQKYFRGALGAPDREWSLKQVVDRIVDTITTWGERDGYFTDAREASAFRDELKFLMVTQRVAFNSPVWFNIGVPGVPNQSSACFILSVDDTMDSILNWYVEEGKIFKGGSGAGANLSKIRGSNELLQGGGTASGPVSFMRGADASAGTIKSGGKTRRAAKMVILDADHPDVEDFVWCKAVEERKARVLRDAGFDMDLDGKDSFSVQYQNANNSVRLTDEFMQAVLDDADWHLRGRLDGAITKTVKARALMRAISEAAWECADPGIQFDTTINRWHTVPESGRITASNPCSEYLSLDNSACNLASLNLLRFLHDEGEGVDGFDIEAFRAAVEVTFTAQEILVGNSDYPTDRIGEITRAYRQIGLGYTNLGALLMALGLPYDSDAGRAVTGAITALMTGHAYLTSARIASRMGPFAGYLPNREHVLRVLNMHREAAAVIDEELVGAELLGAAQCAWDEVCELAPVTGVRNSQATVLAPTGTISFVLDADTTGIEPDLALVKSKKLVGGGSMMIVNQTVPRALRRLGYDATQIEAIIASIAEHKSVIGAPHLRAEHLPVFACSMGDNLIHYLGHVKMLAAAQPFISGSISKTCNLPEEATVDEVELLHIEAWKLGLKCVAIYRDNCKVGQPLSAAKKDDTASGGPALEAAVQPDAVIPAAVPVGVVERVIERIVPQPVRERLPRSRTSRTFEFRVADCKGYVTVGEYADGRPGEIFVRVSKQGSTLAGIMDAFAISLSHGLQYGVPLRSFVAAFVGMRFEPAGMTDDPDIRIASSLIDYLFRRLAIEYLSPEERRDLNILTTGERTQPTLPGVEEAVTVTKAGIDLTPEPPSSRADDAAAFDDAQQLLILTDEGAAVVEPAPPVRAATPVAPPERIRFSDAPMCMTCGIHMQRAGSCFVCIECGSTSGCS
jgi:ribonucleoside-diphosphate reductase alpha chain